MSRLATSHPAVQLAVALCLVLTGCAAAPSREPAALPIDGAADVARLIDIIDTRYAYLTESGCDTHMLRRHLAPRAAEATRPATLIPVLEAALECLHDPHATLSTNLDTSTRLIPSGLEVWAIPEGNAARVTQVRHGTATWASGLRPGDRILRIGSIPVNEAIDQRTPCCQANERAKADARQWALLALLAGTHEYPVVLEIERGGRRRVARFNPALSSPRADTPVSHRRLRDDIGYIALHDLGNYDAVAAFDAALTDLRDTRGLVLDLRDTPGGGNTDVAEPILGRFISHAAPYQKILPMDGPPWLREALPRGPWTYTAPLTVLVSHWTGSMGEGMAMGLDGMQRGAVCGSAMAGLKGAIFDHVLPASGITVKLPGERLAHVDGTPRESWLPPIRVEDAEAASSNTTDAWFNDSVRACLTRQAATAR